MTQIATDFRQDVLNKIRAFVTLTRHDVRTESIIEESTFVGLGLDSLDMVELSMELEDEYHVDLRGVQMTDWTTVKVAIDCIMTSRFKAQDV